MYINTDIVTLRYFDSWLQASYSCQLIALSFHFVKESKGISVRGAFLINPPLPSPLALGCRIIRGLRLSIFSTFWNWQPISTLCSDIFVTICSSCTNITFKFNTVSSHTEVFTLLICTSVSVFPCNIWSGCSSLELKFRTQTPDGENSCRLASEGAVS